MLDWWVKRMGAGARGGAERWRSKHLPGQATAPHFVSGFSNVCFQSLYYSSYKPIARPWWKKEIMIQVRESFSYWFSFSSFPFDLSKEGQVSLLKEAVTQSSLIDLKKVLNIFLLMSQGTTFQVFNHLYSLRIFGIYGNHLNSVEKIKNRVS